jgi:hypothetical protein
MLLAVALWNLKRLWQSLEILNGMIFLAGLVAYAYLLLGFYCLVRALL